MLFGNVFESGIRIVKSSIHLNVLLLLLVQAAEILAKEGISAEVNHNQVTLYSYKFLLFCFKDISSLYFLYRL